MNKNESLSSQLAPPLNHRRTTAEEGKQLPSFTSSAVPSVLMCYVSTQRRPISFPCESDLWLALACLRDATVLQKSPVFSLLLSKNGCCNAALKCLWRKGRKKELSCTAQSLRQLADIPSRVSYCSICLLDLENLLSSVSNTGGLRSRAVRWVTAVTCELQSKCVKIHSVSSWLLDHLPQDTCWNAAMNIWITDSYLQSDKVIAKAKSSWDSNQSPVESSENLLTCEYVSVCVYVFVIGSHTHVYIYTHTLTHTASLEQHVVHPESSAWLMVARILLAW